MAERDKSITESETYTPPAAPWGQLDTYALPFLVVDRLAGVIHLAVDASGAALPAADLLRWSATANPIATADLVLGRSAAGAIAFKDSVAGTKVVTLTIPTGTGNLLPVVVARGRAVAQTAAVASVAAFTVGAADATFEISANVLVTTATTHTFVAQVTYTDEGNTARTANLPFRLVGSTTALVTSIANATGTVPYMGVPITIRAKAATVITIITEAAGTYTTVVFNIDGTIKKVD